VASIVLGLTNRAEGLHLRSHDDGLTEPAEINRVACRRAKSRPVGFMYVYFAVSPEFKPATPCNVAVSVEYFDAAPGRLSVDYDAVGRHDNRRRPFQATRIVESLEGSRRWRTAWFFLEGASFQNGQHARSDFRLSIVAEDFMVRSVAVLGLDRNPLLRGQLDLPGGLVPARAAGLPSQLLDLSPHYTAAFEKNWHGNDEANNLVELPRGRQMLAGTEFDVRASFNWPVPMRGATPCFRPMSRAFGWT